MEYVVFAEVEGSRRVGTVLDVDREPIEDRIKRISDDLNAQFRLAERYDISPIVAQTIRDAEEVGGAEDVNLRRLVVLIYLQGRDDMQAEMIERRGRQMIDHQN